MEKEGVVISVFGSGGGVAKSLLALLNKSITDPDDPLHSVIQLSELHLVDLKQKDMEYYKQKCPELTELIKLYQFDLHDLKKVRKHLMKTNTSLVVDLSWADTVNVLGICNDMGISYVNSALEIVEVDYDEDLEGFTLIERYERFMEAKDKFTNMKGIVCSGMNPGVVQWMAHTLMSAYPEDKPLGCFIVENDTTFFKDESNVRNKTVYSTWSPECFLDEAILNYPMYVKQHVPLFLYEDVYRKEFKVTLGDIEFYGCLMPHEEVLSLSTLYDMEMGFIYKVNDYTTQLIRTKLAQNKVDNLWDWNFKVLDPAEAELVGEDLVGVLLVYEDKERFIYNVMDSNSTYKKYGTNATYIQVASGIYAAICTILLETIPNGVHYVEELLSTIKDIGYGKYVTQYMTEFVTGENEKSDGLILDRMKDVSL